MREGVRQFRSEEHTSELHHFPPRRSSDLAFNARNKRVNPLSVDALIGKRLDVAPKLGAQPIRREPLHLGRFNERAFVKLCLLRGRRARQEEQCEKESDSLDRKSTRLNSITSLHDALPISPSMRAISA